ncbi:MAG: hypothetical protein Q7K57_51455 [Burkholderiaceae bacterium]|nr:hypothetical protein [Burkholderiaceae bacterium]
MPSKSLLLVASLTLSGLIAIAAEPKKPDCAPFALPDLKLTWVAPDIVHNGTPLQIRRFDSTDNVQAILARYRREWKSSAQSPQDAIEYTVGGYQVIAKLRDMCFYTVQARSNGAGGSTGMLAVSQIQDSNQPRVLGKDFPMMSGSLVAADMTHRDPGKEARTIMLMNQFSTNANADFYRRVIGGDGWNITSDHLVRFKGGNGNGYAITFKRGFNETSMVISRTEGGSSVLVNLVEQP